MAPEPELLEGRLIYRQGPEEDDIELRYSEGPNGHLHLHSIAASRPLTTDRLRDLPVGRLAAWLNGPRKSWRSVLEAGGEVILVADARWMEARRPPLKLNVPSGRKRPDAFYRRVAELHSWLVAEGSRRPALTIAEANDLPVTTVHRWMKEARSRGLTHGEG